VAALIIASGSECHELFPLAGGSVTIGRLAGCDIQIDDKRVSREHARLWFDPVQRRYLIADLGSANGTSVNGVRLKGEELLADGDEIRLGTMMVRFSAKTPTWDPSGSPGSGRLSGQELFSTKG